MSNLAPRGQVREQLGRRLCGVQPAAQTQRLQRGSHVLAGPTAHHVGDPHHPPASIRLLNLAVEQSWCPVPHLFPSYLARDPGAEMGSQGIEVEVEAIAREDREPAGR